MLEMYVVYAHPSDYPHNYVLRRWVVTGAGDRLPDHDWFALGATLEEVRAHVPVHCVRTERHPNDEPQIVEVWV